MATNCCFVNSPSRPAPWASVTGVPNALLVEATATTYWFSPSGLLKTHVAVFPEVVKLLTLGTVAALVPVPPTSFSELAATLTPPATLTGWLKTTEIVVMVLQGRLVSSAEPGLQGVAQGRAAEAVRIEVAVDTSTSLCHH